MISVSLSSDSSGELHIFWHDGNSLGVDGAEVGVFEKSDHVSFSGFLEGEDGGALESEVVLEFGSDFTDESLEGELADEEFSGFLEFSDFSESDGSGTESVGSLDTSGNLLGGSLGGNVLSGVFTSGTLTSGHLGAGHFKYEIIKLKIKRSRFIDSTLNICNLIGLKRIIGPYSALSTDFSTFRPISAD